MPFSAARAPKALLQQWKRRTWWLIQAFGVFNFSKLANSSLLNHYACNFFAEHDFVSVQ